jgi:hypothetical protein
MRVEWNVGSLRGLTNEPTFPVASGGLAHEVPRSVCFICYYMTIYIFRGVIREWLASSVRVYGDASGECEKF